MLISHMHVTVTLTLDMLQEEKELTNYVGMLNGKIKSVANMCNAVYKKDCHTKPVITQTHLLQVQRMKRS